MKRSFLRDAVVNDVITTKRSLEEIVAEVAIVKATSDAAKELKDAMPAVSLFV